MKHSLVALLILLLSMAPQTLWAQDSDLKKEVDELKALVKRQNQRIAELEGKVGKGVPGTNDNWLPSMKSEKIEIGGELEMEYHWSERDTDEDAKGHFDNPVNRRLQGTFNMDKADIYVKAKWNDVLHLFYEAEFFEASAIMDTCWAQADLVKNDNNDFWVRFGLDHRFTKYSRSTEMYPLGGAVSWRDEFSQLRLHGAHSFGHEKKWLYWDAFVGNSLNADVTDSLMKQHVRANEMLQDDNDFEWDLEGMHQWGGGIGVNPDFGAYGKFDLGIWHIRDRLNDDIAGSGLSDMLHHFYVSNGYLTAGEAFQAGTANGIPSYNLNLDEDRRETGVRLIYENKFNEDKIALKVIGELIDKEDGEVDRKMWYAEGSLKFKVPGIAIGNDEKWFTSIQPLIRFEDYDVDNDFDNVLGRPATWDRTRLMIAVNFDVTKNSILRFEYSKNGEDIDHDGVDRMNNALISEVDNDEFLIQYELKF